MNLKSNFRLKLGKDKGLITLFAYLLSSCGSQQPTTSGILGVSDSARTSLIGNLYPEGTTDVHPGIPVNQGEKLYFIDMKDEKSLHKGYAIDCAGGTLAALASNAFGFDASSTVPSERTYTALQADFKIDEQPIFRCSGLNPKPQIQQIRNVFQLVKDTPESESWPDLYLRFNSFPGDNFDVSDFYSVGCRNILNAFGTPGQADLKDAIPILASTANKIFPGLAQYKPLNCQSSTLPPLLDAKPKRKDELVMRTTQPYLDWELEFYKVKNLDQSTAVYMVGTYDTFHRINCPGVSANQITTAFNFPADYQIHEVDVNDPIYLGSEQNSQLYCINSQLPQQHKFTKKLVTARSSPPINYFYLPDPASIIQFGCPAATAFFTEGLGLPDTEVTYESIRYLKSDEAAEHVADEVFPCYDRVNEYRSLVAGIYQDIHGVTDQLIIDQTVNECRDQLDNPCTQATLEKKFIDKLKQSKLASADVVINAFKTAQNRVPFPEELNYFQRKFRENGSVRPYYRELMAQLSGASSLDRTLFVNTVRNVAGTDYQDNWLDLWTTKLLSSDTPIAVTAALLTADFISRQSRDELISRVYSIKYAATAKAFHKSKISEKITAGSVKASFQDISLFLDKLTPECVNVLPTLQTQPFDFLKPRGKISSWSGSWSATKINGVQVMVGPVGHPGRTPENWALNSANLGALLVAPKDKAGKWLPWIGWKDKVTFTASIELNLIANDRKDAAAYSDNKGALKVCVE